MRIDLLPPDGNIYKANLHCHSKNHDSSAGLTALQLKQLYKDNGYSIIAFSEHDKLTYNNDLNEADFLALPAFETGMVEPKTNKICHFNCIPKHHGIKENYAQLDYSLENANKRIKSLVDDGYLVVYNHPVSSFHESEEFLNLKGIFALEIYNNVVEVISRTGWSDVYYDTMSESESSGTKCHLTNGEF
jgi:predicted metal-dependent phosphoesterase TrpH